MIDSYAVLQNDTAVGNNARLGGLSALSAGQSIPDGETWEGSPAWRVRSSHRTAAAAALCRPLEKTGPSGVFVVAGMAVAALFFMTLFPGFILIDWIDTNSWNLFEEGNETYPLTAFWFDFLLSIPASLVLMTLTVFLGGGAASAFSAAARGGDLLHLWPRLLPQVALEPRVGQQSLRAARHIRHDIRAGWLRLMGAKVGRHAEVSTAMGIVPDLLTLGDDSFIADGVMLGDEEQRGGWMVLRPTASAIVRSWATALMWLTARPCRTTC